VHIAYERIIRDEFHCVLFQAATAQSSVRVEAAQQKHAACPPEPENVDHLKRAGFPARFVDGYGEMWLEREQCGLHGREEQFESSSTMKYLILLGCFILALHAGMAHAAALTVKMAVPKTYGQKTIAKMELVNTFTNTIESARAVLFLLDDDGKVVGQETRWIIGGTKDRPPLAPDAKTTFNFVIQTNKPFTRTKVTVTRIVLEGGKLVDLSKDVQIESVAK